MTPASLLVTLADAPQHRPLLVAGVSGRRRLVHRLASLGLVRGARIEVMRRHSTTVVAIGDCRIALGPEAAACVEVVEP